jgi:glutamate/tyrosine decarboxylase-like PLP-dependent enzyme
VPDPLLTKHETEEALAFIADEAMRYLAGLDTDRVRHADADAAAERFAGALPEDGDGALEALATLVHDGLDAAIRSAGPRFFHWVVGGGTPAAVGADWLTTVLDQNASSWASSPLGARLEAVSLAWLKDLFGLPTTWGGVLTTGATMANFVALAAARQWWGERHGVDVAARGLSGLPPVPVFGGGYVHPSDTKTLAMLGIGRDQPRVFSRDAIGRIDLDALEDALRALGGAPAIVIASAGEVNAGDFDPIDAMADLAQRYGAWLHVDGAFGLFARVADSTRALGSGAERADSVIADGHKWLNVPYDNGFTFVREAALLPKVFSLAAAYLPRPDDPRPVFMNFAPESSRRARALPIWATLRAYGRAGYRAMVERHVALAKRLAAGVDAAPDLERLAETRFNIVCFRVHPRGVDDEPRLNELNRRIGAAVLEDGRVFFGTTEYGGRVAFRPAIVNWRTTERDVDLILDVTRELAARELQRV